MNPLVFMILTSERDMREQLEKKRLREEAKACESAPQPEQKNCKEFSFRLDAKKGCECCE